MLEFVVSGLQRAIRCTQVFRAARNIRRNDCINDCYLLVRGVVGFSRRDCQGQPVCAPGFDFKKFKGVSYCGCAFRIAELLY